MKKENRILKREEFAEIIHGTPTIKTKGFVIHYQPNENGFPRIGIQVSKKANGIAVRRNRIKRQIRAIIDKDIDIIGPINLVVIVRAAYDPKNFKEHESELLEIIKKIGADN